MPCDYHAHVAAIGELVQRVVNVRDAARHARSEIAARAAEDDNPAAGHVLAAVISHPFHYRYGTRISHRKSIER